ncbi:hypothetical protein TCAL_07528 [Tigriopus californicus]|uniref:Uncharacterized protein n=1 Tax=Tigriopus californicus TaxID=6832 RepID=A0A553NZR3_TIGCA|nr:uncharacterized protein LOC131886323 [Tigriopus californicus]XP_059090597.1 uncharacterized protein LOC131886323 [Tigriopus californicus]TRY70908.1 hypothetical protein TCAL_07528 [Tigriopus californicus]
MAMVGVASAKAKVLFSKFHHRKDALPILPISVHQTPIGAFPNGAPQPSKIPVLLYYISCVFCVIASIMIVQSFRLAKSDDREQILHMGLGLATTGIIIGIIMNVLNKRENNNFIRYVSYQAEAMKNDHNSRQKFNEAGECFPPEATGPNGLR